MRSRTSHRPSGSHHHIRDRQQPPERVPITQLQNWSAVSAFRLQAPGQCRRHRAAGSAPGPHQLTQSTPLSLQHLPPPCTTLACPKAQVGMDSPLTLPSRLLLGNPTSTHLVQGSLQASLSTLTEGHPCLRCTHDLVSPAPTGSGSCPPGPSAYPSRPGPSVGPNEPTGHLCPSTGPKGIGFYVTIIAICSHVNFSQGIDTPHPPHPEPLLPTPFPHNLTAPPPLQMLYYFYLFCMLGFCINTSENNIKL